MTTTRGKLLAAAVIAALAFLAHAGSLGYGFVFDEELLIRNNPAVRDLTNLKPILFEKFWPGPVRGVYYRPAITLSYAVNYAIAGYSPWTYHLTNVLTHCAASVLVFLLVARLARDGRVAALAAALFALAPVHGESVAWVPGRTDTIATALMLCSWLSLLRARERRGGIAWHVLALAAYVGALGGKEVAVALPALILLADAVFEGRGAWKRWHEYAGLAVATAAFMALRAWALSGPGGDPAPDPVAQLGLMGQAGSILVIMGSALRTTIFSVGWRIDFAWEQTILSAPAWTSLASFIVIAGLLALAAWARARRPLLTFSILGFFVSMAPMSHLLPFPTAFAERFLYLPSVFVALGLADALSPLLFTKDSGARRPALVVFSLLLAILAAMSVTRSRPFHSGLTFWRAAVSQAPESAAARNWLGLAYRDEGMYEHALEQYDAAYRLDPAHSVARMNRAEVMMKFGEFDEALVLLQGLSVNDPRNPELLFNLGAVNWSLARHDDARDRWEEALRIDPDFFMAHLRLSLYHLEISKDCARARLHFNGAWRLRPRDSRVVKMEERLRRECHGH